METEQEKKLKKEMDEFEKSLRKENEMERSKGEETLKILAERKRKLVEKKRLMIKADVDRAAAAGASEEEQKKIIEQYQKEVNLVENKMDQERLRVQSQLEERLKKRKHDRLNSKKEELEQKQSNELQEFDEMSKLNMDQLQREQITELETTSGENVKNYPMKTKKMVEKKPILKTVNEPTSSPPIDFENIQRTPPIDQILQKQLLLKEASELLPAASTMSEESLHKALENSPLFVTLQEIRNYLQNEEATFSSHGITTSGPDVNTTDEKFVPTPLGSLNVRELVSYKFALFIVSLLRKKRTSHPPVCLLVAESIPLCQSAPASNPFRGSFRFDSGNGILYIRRTRLLGDSVGRLSLLLVHTMASLSTGGFQEQLSSEFLDEFYQCLTVLGDELFFARSASTSADQSKEKK